MRRLSSHIEPTVWQGRNTNLEIHNPQIHSLSAAEAKLAGISHHTYMYTHRETRVRANIQVFSAGSCDLVLQLVETRDDSQSET